MTVLVSSFEINILTKSLFFIIIACTTCYILALKFIKNRKLLRVIKLISFLCIIFGFLLKYYKYNCMSQEIRAVCYSRNAPICSYECYERHGGEMQYRQEIETRRQQSEKNMCYKLYEIHSNYKFFWE